MRVETAHGYYITDEEGRFHSEGSEPAIVENSYTQVDELGVESEVEWYKARYTHWIRERTERDRWRLFTPDSD